MTHWVVLKSVRIPRAGELWDRQLIVGEVEADTRAEAEALARRRWRGKLAAVSRISFEITEAEYLARGLEPYWIRQLPPGSVDAPIVAPRAPVTPAPGDETPPPTLTTHELRALRIKQARQRYNAERRAKRAEMAERARRAQGRE